MLIAADGGLAHCLAWGMPPDLLIGDLDSVPPAAVDAMRQRGGLVQDHPRRKQANDLELALQAVLTAGHERAVVLAGVGGRWDQSLASFLLMAHEQFASLQVELADDRQWASLLRPGPGLTLPGAAGDTVSLLALTPTADGVTTAGLEYPLNKEQLILGSSRGISNTIVSLPSTVEVERGLVLCLLGRAGDIPPVDQGGT